MTPHPKGEEGWAENLGLNWEKICSNEKTLREFIDMLLSSQRSSLLHEWKEKVGKWASEKRKQLDKHEYCKNEGERWENGYDCAMYDLTCLLDEGLSEKK